MSMNVVLELVTNPDPCSLLCLIALLACVGNKMTAGRGDLHAWGYRIAAGAFVAFGLYATMAFAPTTADDFLSIALRSLFAAGLSLGLSWILLAVVVNLAQTTARMLETSWRATVEQLAKRRNERARFRNGQREREQYERLTPERERARHEAAVHAQLQVHAQKRRTAARAQCEFLYHLYSPEIETRFPRSKFEDFIAKYLSDRELPEVVETNADQLRALLDTHVKKADPRLRFKSLQDLQAWYRSQKAQIDALQEGGLKGSLYAELEARHTELALQLMEDLSP